MMNMTRMTREILDSQASLSMKFLLKRWFSLRARGSCWRQIPKFRRYLHIEHSSYPMTQARASLCCLCLDMGKLGYSNGWMDVSCPDKLKGHSLDQLNLHPKVANNM